MVDRMLVVALGGVLGGCGGQGTRPASTADVGTATTATAATAPAARPAPGAAVLADAAALRDAICGCRDEACLRQPSAAYGELFSRHAEADVEAASWDLAPIAATIDFCQARVRGDNLADQAIAEFERATVAMCACQDKACADRVNADLEVVMERYTEAKGTPAQARRLKPTTERYIECSKRATSGGPSASAIPSQSPSRGAGPVDANSKPSR